MSVQVTLDLTPQPAMQMRPSPMLVGFAEMLALPSMEMERVVAQELADNPALDDVRLACGLCPPAPGRAGAGLAGRVPPHRPLDRWAVPIDRPACLVSHSRRVSHSPGTLARRCPCTSAQALLPPVFSDPWTSDRSGGNP